MTTNIKISLLITIPLLFALSCKKKEINNIPQGNDPVFKATGAIAGQNFSLTAGDDNAYMYTYTDNVNGVKKYTGKLSDGETEIQFGFFDGNIDAPFSLSPTLLSNPITWASDPVSPLAYLSKNAFSNANNISSIEWYLDNVHVGTDNVYVYKPGLYHVCGEITFTDGSHSDLCNDLILGYNTNANYSLHYNLSPNGNLTAWVAIESGTVESIKWNLDSDELEDDDNTITSLLDNASHKITTTVKFTDGVIRQKSAIVDGSLSGNNIQDFSVFELAALNKQAPKRDFNAEIVVKKDNIQYTSFYPGNTGGVSKINSLDYFGLNSAGNKVYRMNIELNCNLKNTSSGSIVNFNTNAVVGVEIH